MGNFEYVKLIVSMCETDYFKYMKLIFFEYTPFVPK